VQHFLCHSLHLSYCTLPWFSLTSDAVLKYSVTVLCKLVCVTRYFLSVCSG
jgi:hypothetical protein